MQKVTHLKTQTHTSRDRNDDYKQNLDTDLPKNAKYLTTYTLF